MSRIIGRHDGAPPAGTLLAVTDMTLARTLHVWPDGRRAQVLGVIYTVVGAGDDETDEVFDLVLPAPDDEAAAAWWLARGGHEPTPSSIDEALARRGELQRPDRVRVTKVGIEAVYFGGGR